MKGADNKRVGIATHFISSTHMPNLEKELYEASSLTDELVNDIIKKFDQNIAGEYDASKISKIFSASTLEEILNGLEEDNSDWSKQQLKLLAKMSPTSLKVSIKQLRAGAQMDLKSGLQMGKIMIDQ